MTALDTVSAVDGLVSSIVNETELAEAYRYPQTSPWLRANMVASLDGAASHEGEVGPLGSEVDQQVFSLLRGLVLSDDNGDDNDDNQRHAIPTVGHRSPTFIGHQACAAVDYGSVSVFSSGSG